MEEIDEDYDFQAEKDEIDMYDAILRASQEQADVNS